MNSAVKVTLFDVTGRSIGVILAGTNRQGITP